MRSPVEHQGGTRASLLAAFTAAFGLAVATTGAERPELPAKPRVSIRSVEATPKVVAEARTAGRLDALVRLLGEVDDLLAASLSSTGRFELMAPDDLAEPIGDRRLEGAGAGEPNESRTGVRGQASKSTYRLDIEVERFEPVVEIEASEGSEVEHAAIGIEATMRIEDASSGRTIASVLVPVEVRSHRATLTEAARTGRPDDALVAEAIGSLTRRLANEVMDWLGPARVTGGAGGLFTLNRGRGAGVAEGQIWRILHPSGARIDPSTGERIEPGRLPIGWVRIEVVADRKSRGVAIQDFGIAAGDIAQLVPAGLPVGGVTPARVDSVPSKADGNQPEASPPVDPASDRPRRLALFVQDVVPDLPQRHVSTLEALLAVRLSSAAVSVVPGTIAMRTASEVADSIDSGGILESRYATVERLLGDRGAAMALAAELGADGLVLAVVQGRFTGKRRVRDPQQGIETDVIVSLIDVSWSLFDGADGANIKSGGTVVRGQIREDAEAARVESSLDRQLATAADRVSAAIAIAWADHEARLPGTLDEDVPVQVELELLELTVPEIVERDGDWFATGERLPLTPGRCEVFVDDRLVGTAPCRTTVPPGPHRIRIERPGLETVDECFVAGEDGLVLTIPMRLVEGAGRRVRRIAEPLESLDVDVPLLPEQRTLVERYAGVLTRARLALDPDARTDLDDGVVWTRWLQP